MVFNLKGKFFLKLDEKAPATPVTVAPVAEPAKPAPKQAAKAEVSLLVAAPQGTAPTAAKSVEAPAAADAAASAQPAASTSLTTAEAIAAELAAAQAARPAVSSATFAPDCLTPGSALPMRRRRGGANLAEFKAMAGSLFGKR
jgi:hypothetical protein